MNSQRNKHKIIDLEAMVQEEEKKISEQDIEKEVHRLLDPRTINTRATQFIRTQAESWRMKTLLVKALSMQGEYAEHLQRLQNISKAKTEEHMAIIESLEFKMSALDQQVDTINKKLTIMIKLLRHVMDKTLGQLKFRRMNRQEINREIIPSLGRQAYQGLNQSRRLPNIMWYSSFQGALSSVVGICVIAAGSPCSLLVCGLVSMMLLVPVSCLFQTGLQLFVLLLSLLLCHPTRCAFVSFQLVWRSILVNFEGRPAIWWPSVYKCRRFVLYFSIF